MKSEFGKWCKDHQITDAKLCRTAIEKKQKEEKAQACKTMVFLGVAMAGRIANIMQQHKTKSQACDTIQQLASSLTRAELKSAPPDFQWRLIQCALANETPHAGGNPEKAGEIANEVRTHLACTAESGLGQCAANAGFSLGGPLSDASILASTGVDRTLAQYSHQVDLEGMIRGIESGHGADTVFGALLGNVNHPVVPALMELGRAVQKSGLSLSGDSSLSQTRDHGSVGGSSGQGQPSSAGSPGSESNWTSWWPFGKKEDAGNPSSADRAPAGADLSHDIFHGSSSKSLFEIVSDRLNQSRERVEKLNWATDLNRAMHGGK